MAYRETDVQHTETCWSCEEPTSDLCGCCGRPTCSRHLEKHRWCSACSESYYRYDRGTAGDGIVSWYAGIGVVLGVGSALSATLLIPLVAWLVAGFPVTWAVRKGRKRTRFLKRYRKTGKMLEAPKRGGGGVGNDYVFYDPNP